MDLSAIPRLGPRIRALIQEDFLHMHPKKTLVQLHDTPKDETSIVYATVNGFVDVSSMFFRWCLGMVLYILCLPQFLIYVL